MKKVESVNEFLLRLDHPYKKEIELLRSIILRSNANITEHVKWNAPSFCYKGEDRITFRLFPAKNIQLIFHRGAKVKSDSATFEFEDPSGLIKWITPDRGTVTFQTEYEIKADEESFIKLVSEWIKAD